MASPAKERMMLTDDEWSLIRSLKSAGAGASESGVLRIALLFGAFAIAMALFLAPAVEKQAESLAAASSLDPTTTGSVKGGKTERYVIRRSVLQASPDSTCVISSAGIRSGDCN